MTTMEQRMEDPTHDQIQEQDRQDQHERHDAGETQAGAGEGHDPAETTPAQETPSDDRRRDELNSIRLQLGEWVLHDVPFTDDDLRQIARRILALCD
jgi:hypothetical protein